MWIGPTNLRRKKRCPPLEYRGCTLPTVDGEQCTPVDTCGLLSAFRAYCARSASSSRCRISLKCTSPPPASCSMKRTMVSCARVCVGHNHGFNGARVLWMDKTTPWFYSGRTCKDLRLKHIVKVKPWFYNGRTCVCCYNRGRNITVVFSGVSSSSHLYNAAGTLFCLGASRLTTLTDT